MRKTSFFIGLVLVVICLFFFYQALRSILFMVWYFLPLGIAMLLGIALIRYGLKSDRKTKSKRF